MTTRYRCYGLELDADRPLPWFAPGDSARRADVRLEFAESAAAFAAHGAPRYTSQALAEAGAAAVEIHEGEIAGTRYTQIAYADGCRFEVSATGDHIRIAWPRHFTIEDAMTYLTGPILGYALRRRGRFALHASGVSFDGKALVFAGEGGAGKSTLAAACVTGGAVAVTDDVAAFVCGDEPRVSAGYGHFRLWDASVAALGNRGAATSLLTPNWTKRLLAVDTIVDAPAAAVYVLGDPVAALRVEPLPVAEATIELARLAFAARWMTREELAASFVDAARVATMVPVARLHGSRHDADAAVSVVRQHRGT